LGRGDDQLLPSAYRLLLTDRNLDSSRYVMPYDPLSDRGPLRERNGVWYWNPNYTSEFMVDADLRLRDCIDFEFISHNRDICRQNGSACPDKKASVYLTGGRMLAFLIGNNIHAIDCVLKRPSTYDKARLLSDAVDTGIAGILRALGSSKDHFNGVIRAEASRQAIVQGALTLYGADQRNAARSLIALLKSQDVFDQALEELVNRHFGIRDWTLPE
jgi:hypothetical protein